VSTVPPSPADVDAHLARIDADGSTIVEGAIDPELIAALRDAIRRLERELDFRPRDTAAEGHATHRMLTDLTAANGGTRYVPGSHRWREIPRDGVATPGTDVRLLEMPAGSVMVFRGSLWHGGGANTTRDERLGVNVQ
jgi:ectoine hydroxylase-related dioxygenase (phytanoyl-CoA dioxygenase family)